MEGKFWHELAFTASKNSAKQAGNAGFCIFRALAGLRDLL
jgi:hypothetical protein